MQLLPFFEKHSPGIKFFPELVQLFVLQKWLCLSNWNLPQEDISPIICGQNYCQLSSPVAQWAQSPSVQGGSLCVCMQTDDHVHCWEHWMRCHPIVVQEGDTAERGWRPFIYLYPILLEIPDKNCGCYLSAGHTWKGIVCFLQYLLCLDVGVGWVLIRSLKDLFGAFCVPHETKVVKKLSLVARCRIPQTEAFRQMVQSVIHDFLLGIILIDYCANLNTYCKGVAFLWQSGCVIDFTPFLSLLFLGVNLKYDCWSSWIPSLICGLLEVKKMLVT